MDRQTKKTLIAVFIADTVLFLGLIWWIITLIHSCPNCGQIGG